MLCWPAFAHAAPSFDCARARSDLEHLICADAELSTLDRNEAARYQELRRAVSPDGAAALLKQQRAWLASRENCLKGINARDRDFQIDCLKTLYREPSGSIDASFRHSGTLTLEERGSTRRLPRLRVTETESHPWLTGSPQARATEFNRYVFQRLSLGKGMFAAAPIELDKPPQGDTDYDRSYEIHWLSARLISIEIFTHHESYFGHGWRQEFALNWDLAHDRPVKVAELFRPDKDWRQAVSDYVLSWLKDNGSFQNPEEIANLADPDDSEGWLFDADGGTLLLGRGERSMVGASADVPIPYDVLRPFLIPDGPLPTGEKP